LDCILSQLNTVHIYNMFLYYPPIDA